MNDILNKSTVLVLNRHWQAIHVKTPAEAFCMDVVFAKGEATVNQICAEIPDAPTDMAVRRMMHILEIGRASCRERV